MVGRKRCHADERISAYFKIPKSTEVSDFLKNTKFLLEKISQFEYYSMNFFTQNWGHITPEVQKMFYPSWETYHNPPFIQNNGEMQNNIVNQNTVFNYRLNVFAKTKLCYEMEELETIKDELDTLPYAFPTRVLKWFNRDDFTEDMILKFDETEARLLLTQWIEKQLGIKFHKNQLESMYNEFSELCRVLGCKIKQYDKDRVKEFINDALEELKLNYSFIKYKKSELTAEEKERYGDLWGFKKTDIQIITFEV